jgi:hypothetical protein
LRWARLFEEHAAALLTFATSLGLEASAAEIATGRVLRDLAAKAASAGSSGDERRLLQAALMTSVARAEHALRASRRRHPTAPVRTGAARLVPQPSTSPARPA